MAPLSRLPAELLAEIFVLLDRSSDADQDRVSVMCCCKQWHHVALRTPDLWATIRIRHTKDDDNPDTCSVESHVQTSLNRAGNAPLRITLDEPYTLYHPKCSIKALLAQADRWHSFIQLGSYAMNSAVSSGLGFINLVQLSISTLNRPDSNFTVSNTTVSLPQLTVLKVEIVTIWVLPPIMAPLLAVLDVRAYFLSRKVIAELIGTTPLLESLRLSARMTVPSLHVIPTFARLRELSIRIPEWIFTISKPIMLSSPLLRELELAVDPLIAMEPPFEPLPSVKTVTFYFGSPSPGTKASSAARKSNARKWLDVFPAASIVRIANYIEGTPFYSSEVALMMHALFLLQLPTPEHRVLFPDLQHLVLVDVVLGSALNKLLRFLRKRTWTRDGGKLKPGSSKPGDPNRDCLVTLKNCGESGSITNANLRQLEEHLDALR